jgi:hypothetical protein
VAKNRKCHALVENLFPITEPGHGFCALAKKHCKMSREARGLFERLSLGMGLWLHPNQSKVGCVLQFGEREVQPQDRRISIRSLLSLLVEIGSS